MTTIERALDILRKADSQAEVPEQEGEAGVRRCLVRYQTDVQMATALLEQAVEDLMPTEEA